MANLALQGFDWWFRHMVGWSRRPVSWWRRYPVRVRSNLRYGPSPGRFHRLDSFVPTAPGAHPLVFYAHGGGFSILSKDTHWVMANALATRGFAVANVNYRLAPQAPFPQALQDVCLALHWVWEHAEELGGDRAQLVLAGESAGANLVTALAIMLSYERPEAYAQKLFHSDIRVRAVVPACGILQVSDPGRFVRRKPHLPFLVNKRIHQVARYYLGGASGPGSALANPLLFLENAPPPKRPLPPFFIPVGTRDPLLDDTRRLKAALDRLGVPAEAAFYPGGVHAFHAFVWQARAQRCWNDTAQFLQHHLAPSQAQGARAPM